MPLPPDYQFPTPTRACPHHYTRYDQARHCSICLMCDAPMTRNGLQALPEVCPRCGAPSRHGDICLSCLRGCLTFEREPAEIVRRYDAAVPPIGAPIHVRRSAAPSWTVEQGRLIRLNPSADATGEP